MNRETYKNKKITGFSMAEILIALVLLGIIAAFAIPKILQNGEEGRKKAVFRETITLLAQVQQEGMLSGDLTVPKLPDYFFSKINATKVCQGNALTQGCWSAAQGSSPNALGSYEPTEPGCVLHSGVTITGFNPCCHVAGMSTNGIQLDWNGPLPPTELVTINYSSSYVLVRETVMKPSVLYIAVCKSRSDCPHEPKLPHY